MFDGNPRGSSFGAAKCLSNSPVAFDRGLQRQLTLTAQDPERGKRARPSRNGQDYSIFRNSRG